jgi:hypothetical protein
MNAILAINFPTSIAAIFLNLVVIVTTLRTTELKNEVAFLLVCNMAFGDLITGVYLVTITTTRRPLTSGQYFALYLPIYCRCVGVLVIVGIIACIFMLFMITLERYLVIVYSLRPDIRITKKMMKTLVPAFWCLSVAMAIAPFLSTEISYGPDAMCAPLEAQSFNYQTFIGVFEICFDVLFAFMYIKIYLAVKKTRNDAGMQLDRRLAAKFGLIVLTNCILRILPVIILAAIYMVPYFKEMTSETTRLVLYQTFVFVFCGINSCVNPIIVALRIRRFRSAIKVQFKQLVRTNQIIPNHS